MVQLAAVYSTYLQELLSQDSCLLDAVEITPWQPLSSLPKILPGLDRFDLYFHGSNLTDRLSGIPSTRSYLSEMLRLTRARWFSTHLSLLPPGWVWLSLRFGIHLPSPPLDRMFSRFVDNVERLKVEFGRCPLLLENMPVEPGRVYTDIKSPELIRNVVEKTDCDLLLDLPHARIASEAFHMPTIEYLQELPLDRVVEVHTSGPRRRKDGILIDQHDIMQPEDYRLIQWVLAHTPVQLVTLEYFKDREGLQGQITELSRLIKARD